MKAIIFDMDGVLFDTERVGDQAWRQACLLYTSDAADD